MSTPSSEIGSRRLDLAGTRDFAVAGAGPARRAALSAFNRRAGWPRSGRRPPVARRSRGSRSPRSAASAAATRGPLSDYDLVVLLHSERSLPAQGAHRARRPHLVPHLGCRGTPRPQRPHRHPVPPGRGRRPHGGRGPARPRARRRRRAPRRRGPLHRRPRLAGQRPQAAAQLVEAVAAAPPAPGRPRAVHRARAQGGPRRAARHDRAARRWPRRGSPTARTAASTPRTPSCSTSVTPCTSSPVADATASAARSTTPSRRCSAYDDADDLLTAVSSAGRAHRLRPRRHAAPGRPVAARPHPAGRPAPPADDAARVTGCSRSDGEVVLGSTRLAETDEGMPMRAGVVAARAGLPHRPRHARRTWPAARRPRRTPGPAPLRDLFGDLLGLRPRAGHRVGGAGPGRHRRHLAARVGGRALAAAAQRGAPPHRRPAPRRDGRARGRAGAPRLAPRPAARRRTAARHRQGARRPRPLRSPAPR